MKTRFGVRWSILSSGARREFQICVLLITVVPFLSTAFLLLRLHRGEAIGWGSWLAVAMGLICIVILGYVLLSKYPTTIVKLRSYLEDMVAGTLPEKIELVRQEDDFAAIETSLNLLLEQLKQRFEAVQLEKTQLEEELGHVRYLEAIGTLASGIAHEISTPIQFISDNTRFLAEATRALLDALPCPPGGAKPDNEQHDGDRGDAESRVQEAEDTEYLRTEIPKAIRQSQEGVRRIEAVVRAMKAYASRDGGEPAETDLNAMIENAVEVTRNEWKYTADVKLELADDLPRLVCIGQDIQQVLLNVIGNAVQAVSQTADQPGQQKGLIRITTAKSRDRVMIRIHDTGPGIPEQRRASVFEPSFTAREGTHTPGQDLAMAYWLVTRKHGGSMILEPDRGRGSVFTVSLPIAGKAGRPGEEQTDTTHAPPGDPQPPESGAQELSVLFVDDSENVLWALERTLHVMRGHWDMAFVSSAAEALALLSKRSYDVIVADSHMPEQGGQELLSEIGQQHPRMGRVLFSGDADLLDSVKAMGLPYTVIPKPCERAALEAAVREALSAARGDAETMDVDTGATQ